MSHTSQQIRYRVLFTCRSGEDAGRLAERAERGCGFSAHAGETRVAYLHFCTAEEPQCSRFGHGGRVSVGAAGPEVEGRLRSDGSRRKRCMWPVRSNSSSSLAAPVTAPPRPFSSSHLWAERTSSLFLLIPSITAQYEACEFRRSRS
jgi:hypothetical protein